MYMFNNTHIELFGFHTLTQFGRFILLIFY